MLATESNISKYRNTYHCLFCPSRYLTTYAWDLVYIYMRFDGLDREYDITLANGMAYIGGLGLGMGVWFGISLLFWWVACMS